MSGPTGFTRAKRALQAALRDGSYQHEARSGINTKNLLATGAVSAETVLEVVKRCNGSHCESSPHHSVPSVMVHVLRRDGWYIKFYFVDPVTTFISVHQ